MTLADSVTEKVYALIAVFEGERLTAYQDPYGVWTIGMGHTGPDVHAGLTISSAQSLENFYADIAPLRRQADLITPILGPNVSEWQTAALITFGYNCGLAAMTQSGRMTDYIHEHGHVLPGLVARRRLEALLYSNV
jgi:lysozyme